ncbi:MAG: TatD family hydrolase [Christensenellaceae bacterium]|jgi:TatD DNase family protein|nr:TatD family hydrolase [Christensenellaceae bacterium]
MVIDTHTHINDPVLFKDADSIISSLHEDNISRIVVVGYDRLSSERAVLLAEKHPTVFAAVGIHPHSASVFCEADYVYFSNIAMSLDVIAIGEIGLDYFHNLSPKDIQKRVFVEQLILADTLKLPIIIHSRDADYDMLSLLKDNRHYLNQGFVLHCFSQTLEYANKIISAFDSVYFSFGGLITFKNACKEEIIRGLPLDRLLVETDCPYMTPVPHRGKTNYPKFISLVVEKIKKILPDADIAELTTQNAKTLFKKLV